MTNRIDILIFIFSPFDVPLGYGIEEKIASSKTQ